MVKYKGVWLKGKKYALEIRNPTSKKKEWLGTFITAEEAARAYDSVLRSFGGDETMCNFPHEQHAIPDSLLPFKKRKLEIQPKEETADAENNFQEEVEGILDRGDHTIPETCTLIRELAKTKGLGAEFDMVTQLVSQTISGSLEIDDCIEKLKSVFETRNISKELISTKIGRIRAALEKGAKSFKKTMDIIIYEDPMYKLVSEVLQNSMTAEQAAKMIVKRSEM